MRRYPTRRQKQLHAAAIVAAHCLECDKLCVAHPTNRCTSCRKALGLTLGPHGKLPPGGGDIAPPRRSRKRQREINQARAERLRKQKEG